MIISVLNKKGGSAKTTTAVTLATILGELDKKVLLVDIDPQCNATSLMNIQKPQYTINNLFVERSSKIDYEYVKKCIYETEYKNVSLIPGDEDLDITIDQISVDMTRIPQLILKKSFDYIESDYDFIIVDNTPYFNLLTRNALCSSEQVIIPVDCDGFSYDGLSKLIEKVINTKEELNPNLDILGIFLTKVNKRTNLFKSLNAGYYEQVGDKFMQTYIRQDNKVRESNTLYKPLPYYDKKSKALEDYMKLLLELNILDTDSIKKLYELINTNSNEDIKVKNYIKIKKEN